MENNELDKKAKSYTKTIIYICTAIALVTATCYVYLDKFGVVEAPQGAKEIFEAKDSLIETIAVDSLKNDSL